MGIYLSQPCTHVELEAGVGPTTNFGAGSMQGWRKHMEDAHIAQTDIHPTDDFESPEISVFGVFDGHGGKEVAIFAEHVFVGELLKDPNFLKKNYEAALRSCFHRIDELIETQEHDHLLKTWKDWPNPASGTEYHEWKKSHSAKEPFKPNVLKYSVNLDDSASNKSATVTSHGHKKASRKDVEEMLANFLSRQTNTRTSPSKPIAPAHGGSPSTGKKKTKKNKKHRKKHKKGKKHSNEELSDEAADTDVTVDTCDDSTEEEEEETDEEGQNFSQPASQAVVDTISDRLSLTTLEDAVGALKSEPAPTIENDEVTTVDAESSGTVANAVDEQPSSSSSSRTVAEKTYKILGGKQVCTLPNHRIQAGCTSVVTLLVGDYLYTANAGDSRAVLCRGDGTAYELSLDHKPSNIVEITRIEAAGGYVSNVGRINGNLNLSRSLGDLKYKQCKTLPREHQMITAEPDVTITKVEPDDKFVILGCDGIWDCLTSQQACDFVIEKLALDMKPTEIVTEILKKCLAPNSVKANGIGTDNMTCIIVLLNQKFQVK